MHVLDDVVAGSDLVATSEVLARALERESPDLLLFGQQTRDGGGAMLWAAVAERLQLPFVSQATKLMIGDGTVGVERETEVGIDRIDAKLPAVVAVSDAINEPRYTSLKGMMSAKKKPLETLTAADLNLAADSIGIFGSQTVVLGIAAPPARSGRRHHRRRGRHGAGHLRLPAGAGPRMSGTVHASERLRTASARRASHCAAAESREE